jgi:hypothetical protein
MLRSSSSRPNIRRSILFAVAVLFLFGLENDAVAVSENPTSGISRTAPDFSRIDLNHAQVSLAAYRGKVSR